MRFVRSLIGEYKAIFTNRVVVLVVVVGSMVYGLLYPMPYLNDVVTKQKLLVIDEDRSTLSKDLIFLVGATPQIELVAEVPSLMKAQEIIESNPPNRIIESRQSQDSNTGNVCARSGGARGSALSSDTNLPQGKFHENIESNPPRGIAESTHLDSISQGGDDRAAERSGNSLATSDTNLPQGKFHENIESNPPRGIIESTRLDSISQGGDGRIRADGVLFIPQGFESNAYLGVGTIVSYMGNASYFLVYGAIVEGIHNALEFLSQQIYEIHHPNALSASHISYEAIALYNPSLGYINYALAAVLVFILHQTLIGGSAILTAYQNRIAKESKRYKHIHNPCLDSGDYHQLFQVVLVRICAFSSVYCVWFLVYFGVLFPYFGVHIHASMGDFWRFGIVFIMCCSACGVLLGALLEDESLPTQIILISSMPLVFIMGFIWPSELLPDFLRALAYLIPAYHGIRGFVSLNQMGAELGDVMGHIWALLGIGVFCVGMSIFVLSRKRKRDY